ncbi:MAG: hypothetical protein Q9201_001516 [Fulgogasparrea decipioides]
MAWGQEKCTFCDAPVNSARDLTCGCLPKVLYRKEPRPPIPTFRRFLIHENRVSGTRRVDFVNQFNSLPLEDRKHWEQKYAEDRERYKREKEEYNEALRLDDEILTDKEAEDDCECGNAVWDIRTEPQRRRCEQTWTRYRRDHHKFNQTRKFPAEVVGPGSFHQFAHLPAEIRNRIYYFVFNDADDATELREWQLEFEACNIDSERQFTHLQPLDARILAVNRRVHVEALDILYSSKCFVVDISRSSDLPGFVQCSTGTHAPRPTSKIRRWHILITFTDIAQDFGIQLRDLCNAMKRCIRLDEVRFTWISVPHYWGEIAALVKAYGQMLQTFTELRGVRKVIFTERCPGSETARQTKMLPGFSSIHLASEEVRQAVKNCMESPPIE